MRNKPGLNGFFRFFVLPGIDQFLQFISFLLYFNIEILYKKMYPPKIGKDYHEKYQRIEHHIY